LGPTTERHLARLGIGPGWRCLEVGAGAGAVARWMAARVGPTGRVTAVDLEPRFTPGPDEPQLAVRRHDILAGAIDPGDYDLVHCRLLLVNVGRPERAIAHLVGSLRPGGWLLVEEPGDGRLPGVGDLDPRVAEFNELTARFLAAVGAATPAVDLTLYRRLPTLLTAAGLVAIGGEHTHLLGGAGIRAALVGTLHAMRPYVAGTELADSGGIDRLLELAADPTLLTAGGSTVSLWGRRP
jgi:SAM-dependent methyltransferase